MKREPRTLLELLAARGAIAVAREAGREIAGVRDMARGLRRAAIVGEFILAWVAAADDGPLTITSYMRATGTPDRTAFLHLRQFRELFPDLGPDATPQAFVPILRGKLDREPLSLDVSALVPV